jgi:hypothetical protein
MSRAGYYPVVEVDARCIMLDVFYVAVVIGFFALLWGFTRASERL